jgi:hypothetical protein
MRWIASMVADVHRILTRGGVFMYPWDKREPEKAGKLRLMYEANPMSFLVEQAGGAATNGKQRILDLQPGQAARARERGAGVEERGRARHRLPLRIGRESANSTAIISRFTCRCSSVGRAAHS